MKPHKHPPPQPRPAQWPLVWALFIAMASWAIVMLCLMDDVRLAGGYDFLDRTTEARISSRVIGAAGMFTAWMLFRRSFFSQRAWWWFLASSAAVLVVHMPVFFLLHRHMFQFLAGVLVMDGVGALILRGTPFRAILDWHRSATPFVL